MRPRFWASATRRCFIRFASSGSIPAAQAAGLPKKRRMVQKAPKPIPRLDGFRRLDEMTNLSDCNSLRIRDTQIAWGDSNGRQLSEKGALTTAQYYYVFSFQRIVPGRRSAD